MAHMRTTTTSRSLIKQLQKDDLDAFFIISIANLVVILAQVFHLELQRFSKENDDEGRNHITIFGVI
jgi:hypothetical protein